jgi:ABC-type hemin transport system ATPase subunit
MASPQYVYVMNRLSKTYPGGKQVLKDITLAFLPGAKIGVVGLNGAGKSTLLRIMAGEETEFLGEAWAAEGVSVGHLSQEPQLDPSKDVTGNVMEGVAEKKAKLDRYNELAMNYSDETADEMAKLQDEIDAQGLWDLDAQVEQAMDALRCPPGDAKVDTLSGGEKRRVALAQPRWRSARPVARRCRTMSPSGSRTIFLGKLLNRVVRGQLRALRPGLPPTRTGPKCEHFLTGRRLLAQLILEHSRPGWRPG